MSQTDSLTRMPTPPSTPVSPSDCLAGGGEMGALMRSFDWSKTKLGPVAAWPQSLRTAVSIMLDSAFGMVVAWGPEFIFLYNDRYRLVRLHGGTIEAQSAGRNHGSEFIIRLPAAPQPQATAPAAAMPALSKPLVGNGRRILVVDDNEDAAELLAASLDAMGHRVRVAHDGPSALKIIDEFAPDIALLDIGLPVMDGYELARRLRERIGGRRTRLVAITGYGQAADRQRSEGAGFTAHLVKPVDIERLQTLLQ